MTVPSPTSAQNARTTCPTRASNARPWAPAPLRVGDVVIPGVAGGRGRSRGCLAAYRVPDGGRVWRVGTIPRRREPLAEAWQGKALEHGCGSSWLPGSYGPKLVLLYGTTA